MSKVMKTNLISARVTDRTKRKFKKRCTEHNKTESEMMTMMVDAFIDGRLKIEPTETEKGLYL